MLYISIANFIAFIAVITVNTLANLLPINNISTGEVSEKFQNLFTPAGFTFGIWAIIYTLLGVFSIYQLIKHKNLFPYIHSISWFFVVSCFFNIGWIFSWHYLQIPISMGIMIGLLISLIIIYLNLDIGKADPPRTVKYFIFLPFSIYLGWISVATIANINVLLVYFGLDGLGIQGQALAIVSIVFALCVGIYTLLKRADFAFVIVILWAFIGILARQIIVFNSSYIIIVAASGFAILILFIIILYKWLQLIRKKNI